MALNLSRIFKKLNDRQFDIFFNNFDKSINPSQTKLSYDRLRGCIHDTGATFTPE